MPSKTLLRVVLFVKQVQNFNLFLMKCNITIFPIFLCERVHTITCFPVNLFKTGKHVRHNEFIFSLSLIPGVLYKNASV